MAKEKLTDARIQKLKPEAKSREISDETCSGLRIRISPAGTKSFLWVGRTPSNAVKSVTLGRYPEVSLRQAREAANEARGAIRAGRDPIAEKRALRQPMVGSGSDVTLRSLMMEYGRSAGATKGIWQPRSEKTGRSTAQNVIENVYADLLDREPTSITVDEFAQATNSYVPKKPVNGKTTANGQASKARLYLKPVLDWAAGRGSFAKVGASRRGRLEVADLAVLHDPAVSDDSIRGKRDRILSMDELEAILPLLTYPSPQIGRLKADPATDYRPIACRFLLYTAARLEEMATMKWRDFDRRNGVWRKPSIKSTKGGPRSQDLPLSEAAIAILRSLPGWETSEPDDYVFPNTTGNGPLGNWTRFQANLCEATGTSGWHRHDLRRTASTLMYEFEVPPSTVEQILGHKDPFRSQNLGGSVSHYIQLTKIMRDQRNPQAEALDTLASALQLIENGQIAAE